MVGSGEIAQKWVVCLVRDLPRKDLRFYSLHLKWSLQTKTNIFKGMEICAMVGHLLCTLPIWIWSPLSVCSLELPWEVSTRIDTKVNSKHSLAGWHPQTKANKISLIFDQTILIFINLSQPIILKKQAIQYWQCLNKLTSSYLKSLLMCFKPSTFFFLIFCSYIYLT